MRGKVPTRLFVMFLIALSAISGLALAASPPDPDCSGTITPVEALHGTEITFSLNCVPTAEGADTITYATVGEPSKGTFTGGDGFYSWTAPSNSAGESTFTYSATDNLGNVTQGSVTLVSINNRPVCTDISIDVHSGDASAGALFSCSDADNDPLTYSVTGSGPAHGDISGIQSDGNFTYTADGDYAGPDNFTYTATDGIEAATEASVIANILNAAPECAAPQDISLHANALPYTIYANCTDQDPSDHPPAVTLVEGAGPTLGTLSAFDAETRSWTYTPNNNAVGTDSFQYRVGDGTTTAGPYTQTIVLGNEPPECSQPGSRMMHVSETAQFFPSCYDPDGDPLTFTVTTQPAGGSLAAFNSATGSWTYDPSATGSYSFQYTVTDGIATSAPYTQEIMVNNAAPTCPPKPTVQLQAGNHLEIYPNCSDTDYQDQPLAAPTVTDPPDHGELSAFANGHWSYTPDDGYAGPDSFKYTVTDGTATGGPYTQEITVTNSAPSCFGASHEIRLGKPAVISINCYDQDGHPLTITASAPSKGTVGAVTGSATDGYRVTFTPTALGEGGFTIKAGDGITESAAQLVELEIVANRAPTCFDTTIAHTKVDTPRDFNLYCYDPDYQDEVLVYSIQQQPAPATGSLSAITTQNNQQQVKFTPATGFTGATSFVYRASDGERFIDVTQRIHVADTPFCSPQPDVQVRPGRARMISPYCSFPAGFDQTGVSYVITQQPSKGTLNPSGPMSFNGTRTYTAGANASGADSFSLQVTTQSGANSPVMVQPIDITALANDKPTCFAGQGQMVFNDRGNPLYHDVNCYDPDGDDLTPVKDSDPAHGTLSIVDGALVYTPTAGYAGSDSFSFHVVDELGAVSETITYPLVVKSPEKPTCLAVAPIAVRPGLSKTVRVSCSSPQRDPQTFAVASQPAAGTGTVTQVGPANSNEFRFTATNVEGATSFTLKAINQIGESTPVTVDVTVSPTANDAPVCDSNYFRDQPVAKSATTPLDLAGICKDPDGDPLQFIRVSQPMMLGTVDPAGPATTLNFVAGASTGLTSFTFRAVDNQTPQKQSEVTTFYVKVVDSLAPTCTPGSTLNLRPGKTRPVYFDCVDANGFSQGLTYEITSQPTGGTLLAGDPTHGSRLYTAPGTAGDYSFKYRAVSAANGPSAEYTQNIHVAADVNAVPECYSNGTDDRQSVGRNRTTTLDLVNQACNDPDRDPMTVALAGQPLHGTAAVVNGKIQYTPTTDYTGVDQLQFTVSDDHGGTSAVKTWYLNVVTPPAPTCEAGPALTIRPNQTKWIDLDCVDSVGDRLTYKIGTPPAKGTLSPSGDSFEPYRQYTAGASEGTDSFTFYATSVNGTSQTVTRNVTIDADSNSVPTCHLSGTVAVTGQQTTLRPDCDDDDDDPLSYTKLSNPAHGTVTDVGGVLKYTSAAGYTGPDSFTYSANDGHGGTSSVTTFSITVAAPTGPTCGQPPAISVRPGGSRSLSLDCYDITGAPVTYVFDTQPQKGTLAQPDPEHPDLRVYTAKADATGADSFTYRAISDHGSSSVMTQQITIDPNANVEPYCSSTVELAAKPGVAKELPTPCHDLDNDTMTQVKLTDPTHGTVALVSGKLHYTAAADYEGLDSFTYKVTDGREDSTTITANITVTPSPNTAPVCTDVSSSTPRGTAKAIQLTCSDAEGNPLTISVVSPPPAAQGSLSTVTSGGSVTFTPAAGFVGSATFTFRASDGKALSNVATAAVHVTNAAPACETVPTQNAVAGEKKTISITCTDPDGDVLTPAIVTAPTKGTLSAVSGTGATRTVDYTPAATSTGADSFTFRVSDGASESALQTVNISVNRRPACQAVTDAPVKHHTPTTLTLTCTDPDAFPNAALAYSVVTGPTKGTLGAITGTGATRTVTYTPTGNATGADSFTIKADDGRDASAAQTVSVVIAANQAPVCTAPAALQVAYKGSATTAAIGCTDAEGDAVTLATGTAPTKGTVAYDQAAKKATYTHTATQSGADSFTVVASDGHGGSSSPVTVGVTIAAAPANQAPACQAVSVTTKNHTPASVTLTCTDAENNALTLSTGQAAHGTVSAVSGGKVTYTPTGDYAGADSFTYRASDGTSDSAAATVSITVQANTAPACTDASADVAHNTAKAITLTCTDAEGDPVTPATATAPGHGSVTYDKSTVTYTPAAGFAGDDSFTFTASDGHGGTSAPAKVSLKVAAAPAVTPNPTPVPTPNPTPDPGPGGDNGIGQELSDLIQDLLSTGQGNAGKIDVKKMVIDLGKIKCTKGCNVKIDAQTPPTGLTAQIAAAKKIGSASISVPAGTEKAIKLKLNAAGKKLLKKKRKLKVKINIVITGEGGVSKSSSKTMTLKLKKKR